MTGKGKENRDCLGKEGSVKTEYLNTMLEGRTGKNNE